MAVPDQNPFNVYTANGVTTVFPYEFYLINADDLTVSLDDEAVSTGFTVTGIGNVNGGEVTFLTPPANDVIVMLERVVAPVRLTEYQDNGDLLADTVNLDFDRLWMAIKQSFVSLGVALLRPVFGGPFNAKGYRIASLSDPVNDQDAATKKWTQSQDYALRAKTLRVSDADIPALPNAAQRANKVPAFDGAGNPTVMVPVSGSAADVLVQLAAPTGSRLSGLEQGGTIQDAIKHITPEMFGADGTDAGDTAALIAAMAVAYNTSTCIVLNRMYVSTSPLTCYFVQTHNSGLSIKGLNTYCGVQFKGNISGECLLDIHGYNAQIDTIRIVESTDNATTNVGLRVCGENVRVNGIVSRGYFKKAILGIAAIKSKFSNLDLQIAANTDSTFVGVGIQLTSCVNTGVNGNSFIGRADSSLVIGMLDGETRDGLKPPSLTESITWGCEGVNVSGIKSILANHGLIAQGLEIQVTQSVFDFNKEKFFILQGQQIKITESWFATHPDTPTSHEMFGGSGTGAAYVFVDKCTFDGGQSASQTQTITFNYPYSSFTNNSLGYITSYVSGTNGIACFGNIPSILGSTPDVSLINASDDNVFIPKRGKAKLSNGLLLGKNAAAGAAKQTIRIDSAERAIEIATALGVVLGTTVGGLGVTTTTPSNAAILYLGSMASGGRSLNATGTLNASGADYAEYMLKSAGCGTIAAGDICGVDACGELTDKYDDAISFVVKSTNPSYVGGDTWSNIPGYPELASDATDEEKEAHSAALATWEETYNTERVKYDRIAFSGQVPCNVPGSSPGDYIIPVRAEDGSISGASVSEPTFVQYRSAVGQVWRVMGDGMAWITVKAS